MHRLQKIPRESLRDRVYHILQKAIVAGEIGPEERLRDQELAERLGVSRTPVREALQLLEDEGLVETVPGSLTRVTPLVSGAARDAFPVVASLHALATRLAAGRLTAAHLAAMHRANAALQACMESGDRDGATTADDEFHGVIVDVSENQEIRRTLERIMPKLRRLEFAQFGSLAGRASWQQHHDILRALEQGAVRDAAALVEENWLSLGRLLAPEHESGK
ncbi:MAG TPA: GntR family transcriptional regulator [Symbiobacteriaceae bacterium]|nr:GntR family transcriptional regulator [Symbiobacteriaceae bacterium]